MRTLAFAAALAAATAATPALAAFTLTNSLGGDGYVVTSASGFRLFSSNDDIDDNVTSYGDIATADAIISGDWRYFTYDVDGSSFDLAGYFVNDVFTQLSTNGIARPAVQFGSFSFSVNAGDSYGFYIDATDAALGRGVLTIGSVPEPESWALLIAGFGLVGAMARRRRTVVAA